MATDISRALATTGITVLRIDFTEGGNSEGGFADPVVSSSLNDLVADINFPEVYFQIPQPLIEPKS